MIDGPAGHALLLIVRMMEAGLSHMEWNMLTWTALFWTFAAGILYLIYQFGSRSAAEHGLKMSSWGTVALLLGFVVSVAVFVTGYPFEAVILEFNPDHVMVFLTIFLLVLSTYLLGYLDVLRWMRSGDNPAVSATDPPPST